jgi:hypothetical protein
MLTSVEFDARRGCIGDGVLTEHRGRRRHDVAEHGRNDRRDVLAEMVARRRRIVIRGARCDGLFRTRRRCCGGDGPRQAPRDGHRLHIAMTGRRKGLDDIAEPAAIDDREHVAIAVDRLRIERDMGRLRVLNQLILDDIRQCLAQAWALQRRHGGGEH